MLAVKFCRLGKFIDKLLVKYGSLGWKLGMLKDLKFGRDGRLDMSMLEIPKFLICGIEKPSKFSKPVRGDCNASLGLSSDDELELSDEEDGEEDVDDEDVEGAGEDGDE